MQTYATKGGGRLSQGDGTSGTGWNYWDNIDGFATDPPGPWDVGSGSEELNGTFDMMGNVWEWMESPYISGDFLPGCIRGGSYSNRYSNNPTLSSRGYDNPDNEYYDLGFRVASVPEPCTLVLLSLGGLMLRRKR